MLPFTLTPLPRWIDLLAALLPREVDQEALNSIWIHDSEDAYWFSRSSWSLAAVAKCRINLHHGRKILVWVPSFFCEASLRQLRELNLDVVFYAVNENLMPHESDCIELAIKTPPDIFLFVHYFGQPSDAQFLQIFLKKYGAWLIEDCAHVLNPSPTLGRAGDFVVYSPHKLLPIPDGAVLVVRQNGPNKLSENKFTLSVLKEVHDEMMGTCSDSAAFISSWWAKRFLQILGFRNPHSKYYASEEIDVGSKIPAAKMSNFSKNLLIRMYGCIEKIGIKRKINASKWNSLIPLITGVKKNYFSEENWVPYTFYLKVPESKKRAMLYEYLKKIGGMPTSWPDLPQEILENSVHHLSIINLKNRGIHLPVHQTIEIRDIEMCCKKLLSQIIGGWRLRELTLDEWNSLWIACENTNILQSWQYGEAKQEVEGGWIPYRFLVENDTNEPIALIQILAKEFKFLGGVARINRGPILIKSSTDVDEDIGTRLLALSVILREGRKRRWWMMQVAPELLDTPLANQGLKLLGFNRLKKTPWASGLISLAEDEENLLMRLDGKWRNSLRKGQKLGVKVVHENTAGASLEALIVNYKKLQEKEGFYGLPEVLIRSLAAQVGVLWQFDLFSAFEQGGKVPLGSLVSVRTGDTSIYLIGNSNDVGRKKQANSVLLWNSILFAKSTGCKWFDIGGLSDSTPGGIREFKGGLNSEIYRLCGEWRSIYKPFSII